VRRAAMATSYVLFKDEDFDEQSGELIGPVWIVRSEEDGDEEEQDRWMTRSEAKALAESLGLPFEVDGMTDEELEEFKRQQGLG
jgi:hypothetical protein